VTNRAHTRTSLGAGLPDRIALERLPAPATPWDQLPFILKILIEGAARRAGNGFVREEDVHAYLAWRPGAAAASSGDERD
jgi:hypothetical protein